MDPHSFLEEFFEYQDASDPGDADGKTTFILKRLTIRDMYFIEGLLDTKSPGPGTRTYRALIKGVAGWRNFKADGDDIEFSIDNITSIPLGIRENIVKKVFEISIFPNSIEEELKSVVRTLHVKTKAEDPESWDCAKCKGTSQQQIRRCSLEGFEDTSILNPVLDRYLDVKDKERFAKKRPRSVNVGHTFEKCPVGTTSGRAWALFGLIQESTSTNSLPFLPNALMEQPYFFLQTKRIVDHERYMLEDHKPTKKVASESGDKMPDALALAQSRIKSKRGPGRNARGVE